jgi:multimeric flavodoxin WrbA
MKFNLSLFSSVLLISTIIMSCNQAPKENKEIEEEDSKNEQTVQEDFSVLIINGSPRVEGNTARYLDKVFEGAESVGLKVIHITLNEMDIKGCQGCMGCRETEGCTYKDDFDQLYKDILKADIVVIGTPIYFGNMTGQCKSFIDRLFCFWSSPASILMEGKKAAAIITYAEAGKDTYQIALDELSSDLKGVGFELIFTDAVNSTWEIDDIDSQPETLERAFKFGASLK